MCHGNIFIALLLEKVKRTLQKGTGYLVVPLGADDAHGKAVHVGKGVEGGILCFIQFS